MRLRSISLWTALLFSACVSCHGQRIVVEEVEATGYGASEDKAITDGLIKALEQHVGMSMSAAQAAAMSHQAVHVEQDGQQASASVTTESLESAVAKSTKGVIAGYKIVKMADHSEGFAASLLVRVAMYNNLSDSANTRRTLAFLPMAVTQTGFRIGAEIKPAAIVQHDLMDKLNQMFTQARRFTVLSRLDDKAVAGEMARIQSPEANPLEMVKFGQTLGADFLITGRIHDLAVDVARKRVALTGVEVDYVAKARFKIAYRIVDVATKQIKWSDEVYGDLTASELAGCRGDADNAYDLMLDIAGRGIAKAMENSYPIRLLRKSEDGTVTLDQGGALVLKGQTYEVYRLGDKDVSAYSKASLGREETWIATIEVIRVEAMKSFAKVVKGDIDPDQCPHGAVCRSADPAATGGARPSGGPIPSAVKIDASGGVKLPFD